MSGIKISLKKKNPKLKKLIVNNSQQTDELSEQQKKLITSYSTEDKTTHKDETKPIIVLKQPCKSMLQKEIEIDEKPILPYGVTTFEKVETTKQSMIKKIESEDSDDDSSDDRKIPIDEFGAAFLRGLGWQEEEERNKDDSKSTNTQNLSHRKHGITLGIGAKPIDEEIIQDLNSTEKGIPIIKRRKLNHINK